MLFCHKFCDPHLYLVCLENYMYVTVQCFFLGNWIASEYSGIRTENCVGRPGRLIIFLKIALWMSEKCVRVVGNGLSMFYDCFVEAGTRHCGCRKALVKCWKTVGKHLIVHMCNRRKNPILSENSGIMEVIIRQECRKAIPAQEQLSMAPPGPGAGKARRTLLQCSS